MTFESLPEEEEKKEDGILEELRDPVIGRSVYKALKLFRDRGMLGQKFVVGRNNDKSLDTHLETFAKAGQQVPEVNLRYVDKDGFEQTPKERFRELARKFHGKPPSHKRQKKALEKKQAQLK